MVESRDLEVCGHGYDCGCQVSEAEGAVQGSLQTSCRMEESR